MTKQDSRYLDGPKRRPAQPEAPPAVVPVDPETPVRTTTERPGFFRGARVRK